MTYQLYSLICECDTAYNPEEHKQCPTCTKAHMHHKEFKFDVNKFLETVYTLSADNKERSAADLIVDSFWQLYNKFDIMNEIQGKVDVNKITPSVMFPFLIGTFKYIAQVPNHIGLCDRIETRLREIGEPEFTEERIRNLLTKFRTTGNYWEEMKLFGAPTWLTGPKP